MSAFISGRPTVLAVGTGPAGDAAGAVDRHAFRPPVRRSELQQADAVDHDPTVTARTAADADQARGILDDDDTIGCVVVDDGIDDPAGFVRTVTAASPDLPVVVVAADGDEALAEAVTTAGADTYLSWDGDDAGDEGSDDATDEGTDDAGEYDGQSETETDTEVETAPDSGAYRTLLETVERALRDHDRRFRNAAESEILNTMLREFEVPLYAKDERARHVRMADVPGGPNPVEALGKTDDDLYGDDSADDTLADDRAVIEDGEVVRDRMEKHGEGDAATWFRTTKVPWRGPDGETRGLVGISQEITDLQRRINELEADTERLEDFVNYVTQDLRNPLNVASGYLELARESDNPDLDRVVSALDRMDETLEDLGALARGEGSVESRTDRVELDPLARAVWQGVAPWTATLEIDAPAGTELVASESRLHPLFENLFRNAVDHVGPEVTVTVGLTNDGFYVADDGPGIPESQRDQVLGDGFTTGDGTGTGLAIVTDVADAHDWDVDVTRGRDGGARFEFGNALLVADPDPTDWSGGTARSLDAATDVGDPAHAGESRYDADRDRWTVESAGSDLWRDTAECHFVHAAVEGTVRIEARVADFEGATEWSKAGVVVRDSLEADATQGYVGVTAGGLTEVLWRPAAVEPIRSQQVDLDGAWFRLERVDDRVTCSVSDDGESWRAIDQRRVALADPVFVGLAVTSAMYGEYATASVTDVSVLERSSG